MSQLTNVQANFPDPSTFQQPATLPQYLTPAEMAGKKEAVEGSGALSPVGSAFYSDSYLGTFLRIAQRSLVPPDPTWRGIGSLPEYAQQEILSSIPPEYIPNLASAMSEDELYLMAAQYKGLAQDRERLGSMGMTGAALRLGAAFLDPVAIGVGIATGGAAEVAVAGKALSTAGRFRRMATAGMIAAPFDTAFEAARVAEDPEADVDELVYAFVGSFALTGATSELARGLRLAQKRVEGRDLERYRISMGAASPFEFNQNRMTPREQIRAMLSDQGAEALDEALSPEARKAQLRVMAEAAGVTDDADFAELDALADNEALQWIYNKAMPDGEDFNGIRSPNEFSTEGISDEANGWIDKLRFSLGGYAGRAANRSGDVAFAMRSYVTDILSPTGLSGEAWKTQYLHRMHWRVVNETENLRKLHNEKMRDIGDILTREAWEDNIHRMIQGGRRVDGNVPTEEMERAVEAFRKEYAQLRQMAEKHGVKGFEQFDDNPNYVPRVFDYKKIQQLKLAHGHDRVVTMLSESLREGRIKALLDEEGVADVAARRARRQEMLDNEDFGTFDPNDPESDLVTQAYFDKIAKGYLKKVEGLEANHASQSAFFSGDGGELLDEVLQEQYSDVLTRGEIRSIVSQVTPNEESGRIGNARRKVQFDETYLHEYTNDAGEVMRFGLNEMLDTRISEVTRNYASNLLGEMVSARVRKSMALRLDPTGERQFNNTESMLTAMKNAGASDQDIQLIRRIDEITRGRIPTPNTPAGEGFRKFSKLARLANMARIGGTFGLAQIPEVIGSIAENGLAASIKQMPTFEGFMRAVRDGAATNAMARDVQNSIGSGADAWTHMLGSHTGGGFLEGAESASGRIEKLLVSGSDIVSRVSGLKYIDTVSRTWAARGAIQNVIDQALSDAAGTGRRISKRKLTSLGLTEDQWDRISRAVRDEVNNQRGLVTEKGSWGVKAKRFMPAEWKDQDAAALLIQGVDRWSSRSIQRNSLGSTALWMHNDVAKILLQFQSFHLNAYDQQLLYNLHNFSPVAASRFITTSMAGSAVWMGQHYVRSRSQDDPQEYRDEYLNFGRVVKAGIQRGGMTSLMPQLADSAAYHIGGVDPVFDARNSGLSALFLDLNANPTIQGVTDTLGAARSISQAITGRDDFSETDAARALRLFPFRTAPIIKQLGDYAVERFPDEQRE